MAYNWNTLATPYNLAQETVDNLITYANMIRSWNEKFNLTTIVKEDDIATLHFQDALALTKYIDINTINCIADIGTGAGIPGLALKICYPHLSMVLIEVNGKKRTFLQAVIDELHLTHVTIVSYDWLTFLRNTDYTIDLFCARASLVPEELVKMFAPKSGYQDSTLVYWASKHWNPSALTTPYIKDTYPYTIGDRTYRLIKMAHTKK